MFFILTGISVGILFDLFRILRKSFKTFDFIAYFQDFIFWILTGLILIFSIFIFNNGNLRSYVFIGIIFGIFIYMILISKYFINFFVTIIRYLRKIIGIPIKILYNTTKKYIFMPIIRKINVIHDKISKIKVKKDNLSNKI